MSVRTTVLPRTVAKRLFFCLFLVPVLSSNLFAEGQREMRSGNTQEGAPLYYEPRDLAELPPVTFRGGPFKSCLAGPSSDHESWAQIDVISPKKPGRVSHEDPTIYWTLSAATVPGQSVVVSFKAKSAESSPKPIEIEGAPGEGTHELRFGKYGAKLAPNVHYTVSFTLTCGTDRSADKRIDAGIVYVPQQAPQRSPDCGQNAACIGRRFAQSGYWYDAVEALSRAPQSSEARALLERLVGEGR